MPKWEPDNDDAVALRGARRGHLVTAVGGGLVLAAILAAWAGWRPFGAPTFVVVLAAGGATVLAMLLALGPQSTACAVRRGATGAVAAVTLLAAAWFAW